MQSRPLRISSGKTNATRDDYFFTACATLLLRLRRRWEGFLRRAISIGKGPFESGESDRWGRRLLATTPFSILRQTKNESNDLINKVA